MDRKKLFAVKTDFDKAAPDFEDRGVEYWSARELMPLLGYTEWRNFEKAIKRAMGVCEISGEPVSEHFQETVKIVPIGSGAHREIKDYRMTRHACMLTAMNGDPKKEAVRCAQSYYAIQTIRAEERGIV